MERRINKKIDNYLSEFKENVKEKALELGTNEPCLHQLLQYIYDYERFSLAKEDFMKRKRVKNVVPFFDRCCAKRATNEQCTRRKKEGNEYCGTHTKGTPHGIIDLNENNKTTTQKIDVWAQDIQGIIYFIDKFGNVYQAEDIVINKTNPTIIGKYTKIGDKFSISE